MLLKDKKIIVTGAANGIGHAIFQVFVNLATFGKFERSTAAARDLCRTVTRPGETCARLQ